MTKEEYEKRIKIHKLLGAEQFQKAVFQVEKVKYKILKKYFPKYLEKFDKMIDHQAQKKIKKAKTSDEIKEIKYKAKMIKMKERKDFYSEKNRNYHISSSNPSQILHYLEWNKNVHKKGLIKNSIILPTAIIASFLGVPFMLPIIIYELISMGINIECINLQDYNLCRLKRVEDSIKRREERRKQKDIEELSEATKEVHEAVVESEKLPTVDEIVSKLNTKEELEEMLILLARCKRQRNTELDIDKTMKKTNKIQ